ncbi:hypothetical protein D4765_10455 [Subtercola vilae]|uniref:Uncharacterized protein n=1 Tax=Subtercola vilae TaxID=2056433 RepID=A0A4V4RF18_9MICO|nr:hypothetical protein D4765_10455 [Subtercola vilae]
MIRITQLIAKTAHCMAQPGHPSMPAMLISWIRGKASAVAATGTAAVPLIESAGAWLTADVLAADIESWPGIDS